MKDEDGKDEDDEGRTRRLPPAEEEESCWRYGVESGA